MNRKRTQAIKSGAAWPKAPLNPIERLLCRSFGFRNKCRWWQYTRPSFHATSRQERKQFVDLRSVSVSIPGGRL